MHLSSQRIIYNILIIFIFQPFIFAQDETNQREYHTQKTDHPPVIDGTLNDECWEEGDWAGDFIQRSPKNGEAPSQKTEFKILYNEKNLFVAFKCFDSEPDEIVKLVSRRDQLKGDAIGIAFDSYFDKRTAFEFDVTAAGGKVDMAGFDDGNSWQFSWDAVWYAKTSVTDWGWVAEIQIPFSQLRFSDKKNQLWGLHVQRRIYRHREEDTWEFIPIDAPGMINLFGQLNGLENIKAGNKIELIPYTSLKQRFNEPVDGNPYATGKEFLFNAGLDAKIALSSNFTMDLSCNPDFGQVEADPSELNLSVYETFFDEKRPFFIEGKNLLETNVGVAKMFYSRRIGSKPKYRPDIQNTESIKMPNESTILSSAKITGKTQKGLSVGILESITANEFAFISDSLGNERKSKVQPLTNYLLTKIQKDINNGNTVVGATLSSTHRIFKNDDLNVFNKSAYSGSLNLLHQWKDKTYYIDFKSAFSNINGHERAISKIQQSSIHYYNKPDENHLSYDSSLTKLNGTAGSITFGKAGNGKLRFYERVNWISPGFEINEVGFQTKSDLIDQKTILFYDLYKPTKVYNKITFVLAQYSYWDFGLKNFYNMIENTYTVNFSNLWDLHTSLLYFYNQKDRRVLRGGPSLIVPDAKVLNVWGNTNSQKKLSIDYNFNLNRSINDVSERITSKIGVNYNISSRLQVNLSGNYMTLRNSSQWIKKVDDKYILGTIDQKTFNVTLRAGLYLSPEMSIQYYAMPYFSVGQYSEFKKLAHAGNEDYQSQFYNYTQDEITYLDEGNQYVISDKSGDFILDNPDFRFQELHSNFVFRWEFKPASVFYLVWSHSRSRNMKTTDAFLIDTVKGMSDIYPENTLMVKLKYWLSI